MNKKKTICTLIIAASAFLAYNTITSAQAETTVTEAKEVLPFSKEVKNVKTTTTVKEEKVNIEDIQPAILKELKPETKEVITQTTTIKNEINAQGKPIHIEETTVDRINVGANGVTGTVTTTTKTKELAEGETLPALDKIELPQLSKTPVNNKPVKIEVASQRIPIGTVIPLKLESQISTASSSMGDQFNATLTADVILGNKIILPAGSVVRGTVGNMKKANMLVKEGKVMLIFDHIVTPAGKQIPVYAYLTGSPNINYEGYVTGGSSYGKAFKQDAHKGKEILVNTTTYGVDKGLKYWGGVPVVITAPCCAIGGALGSGGYIIGKSVYNIFKKGNEVTLKPGTLLNATLSKALDIPVN